ncbi:transglutaminase family protein [Aromatoleum toluvorans]|uniref:Transglutaminase family protein n=2 Tax=Aromatoleum toluvorans TaxID=92002 RepID=A0ABX1PXY5_9RHOO|nr:transglutaminase family protein [Aromatoleum toluvorans]
MNMRYHVLHTTEYHYSQPVQTARHLLHLVPRPVPWQMLERQALRIDPEPTTRAHGIDMFGNPADRIEFAASHDHLHVESEQTLTLAPRPWLATPIDGPAWEKVRDALDYRATALGEAIAGAQHMRFESPGVRVKRELEDYAAPSFVAGRPVIDAARDLMRRIHTEFRYDPEATRVGTSVLEVLEMKRGVCQDFAHLMIGCLRSLGLAARYVSGYLRTDPPPGQPRLTGSDASHAWVALFVPELGWIELDPTNDCLADENHLVLAWGRDFGDVSPIRGVIQGGGEHTLKVGVTVTPVELGK